jgi:hypothetical protein
METAKQKKPRKRAPKTIIKNIIVTKTEIPVSENNFKQKTAELNAMLNNTQLR